VCAISQDTLVETLYRGKQFRSRQQLCRVAQVGCDLGKYKGTDGNKKLLNEEKLVRCQAVERLDIGEAILERILNT